MLLGGITSPFDSAWVPTESLMILESEGSFTTGDAVEETVGKEEIHFLFHKLRSLVQSLCPSVIPCLTVTSGHEGFEQKGRDQLSVEMRSL
tara:strand:+ start:3187 stop:3459 length:273 start_codon:yes stop_codon:yes gene_type:complete